MTAEGGTLADVMRAGVEDLVSTNKVKGTTTVPYRSNCTLCSVLWWNSASRRKWNVRIFYVLLLATSNLQSTRGSLESFCDVRYEEEEE